VGWVSCWDPVAYTRCIHLGPSLFLFPFG
jgi:hypothetical protein